MDEEEYVKKKKEINRKMVFLTGSWVVIAMPLIIITEMNSTVFFISMAFFGVVFFIVSKMIRTLNREDVSWISGDDMDDIKLNMLKSGFPFMVISIVEFEVLLYYSLPEAFASGELVLYVLMPLVLLVQYPLLKYLMKEKKRVMGNRRILRASVSPDDMKQIIRKALDKLNIGYDVFEKEKITDPMWHIMVGDKMKIALEEGDRTTVVIISNIPEHMTDTERSIEREISGLIRK